jgi:hypothetical protein
MVHPQAKLVYDIILSMVQERFEDSKGILKIHQSIKEEG